MSDISRRALLGSGTALGLGAVFSSAQAKPYDPMPAKWDEEVDVLIVGSGFAGLAAALEAKKKGANVVVLEKMRTLGGNSIINGGHHGDSRFPDAEEEWDQGHAGTPR